jgi:cellulose synthase/poly-beta-1,6-N-acetylglucosamine synthase-like glycosyltransferase
MVEFHLPRNRLAVMQIVEYFRAFLVGRIGWDSVGALLIVSGAFGLFRRSAVEAVGGYTHGTVGEDIELVVRLHKHFRERGDRYRIAFVPEPTCWTEAPEDFKTLSTQRRRWQRGLGQTLWRHRRMMANPRYGTVGLVALPCFLVFEFIVAVAIGALTVSFLAAFTGVSILIWILLSFSAVLLEEYAVRRYARGFDIVRLVYYSVFESIGYRQLNCYWRCKAFVDLARKKQGWGTMPRRGLERPTEAPPGETIRA